jgi:hypothetical protein
MTAWQSWSGFGRRTTPRDSKRRTGGVHGPRPFYVGQLASRGTTLTAAAPDFVILGDCPSGVDRAAWEWCVAHLRPDQWRCHGADWNRFGHAAGPKRNGAMVAHAVELRAAHPAAAVFVLAFPRGGPGTADCMRQARAAGLAVEEF